MNGKMKSFWGRKKSLYGAESRCRQPLNWFGAQNHNLCNKWTKPSYMDGWAPCKSIISSLARKLVCPPKIKSEAQLASHLPLQSWNTACSPVQPPQAEWCQHKRLLSWFKQWREPFCAPCFERVQLSSNRNRAQQLLLRPSHIAGYNL
jgi:hypothetical protein